MRYNNGDDGEDEEEEKSKYILFFFIIIKLYVKNKLYFQKLIVIFYLIDNKYKMKSKI